MVVDSAAGGGKAAPVGDGDVELVSTCGSKAQAVGSCGDESKAQAVDSAGGAAGGGLPQGVEQFGRASCRGAASEEPLGAGDSDGLECDLAADGALGRTAVSGLGTMHVDSAAGGKEAALVGDSDVELEYEEESRAKAVGSCVVEPKAQAVDAAGDAGGGGLSESFEQFGRASCRGADGVAPFGVRSW